MRIILIIALLVTAMAKADDIDTAHRVRYQREDHISLIEGIGTAFATDLSAWDMKGPHYLITAAHNLYEDDGKERSGLELELTANKWVHFDIVGADRDIDISVIRCANTLPKLASLAEKDTGPKDAVTLYGCPSGIPVHRYPGITLQRFNNGLMFTKVKVEFYYGCSGGPLFNSDSFVVGMAVCGVLTKDKKQLDRGLGLFVPVCAIRSFLDTLK